MTIEDILEGFKGKGTITATNPLDVGTINDNTIKRYSPDINTYQSTDYTSEIKIVPSVKDPRELIAKLFLTGQWNIQGVDVLFKDVEFRYDYNRGCLYAKKIPAGLRTIEEVRIYVSKNIQGDPFWWCVEVDWDTPIFANAAFGGGNTSRYTW